MWEHVTNYLHNHTPLLYWTQSLWRDEAFSVWIAKDGVMTAITRTSGDFNPPLYYVLLNLWMRIFGSTEIALRGFSVLMFLLFLIVIYKFSLELVRSKRFATFTTLLSAFNPMLLYFAFELRMYSLLTLLATLSMYFFFSKRWTGYIVATILGLYTQPFMALLVIAQMTYLLIQKDVRRIFLNSLILFILYLPWLPTLFHQFQNSGPMWMYPINAQLVTSVLGNLYVGYEGTPGEWWPQMQALSVLIIGASLWLWHFKALRQKLTLLYLWVLIPLVIVLSISFFKPIYVHRYLIYVSIALSLLVSLFIHQLKTTNRRLISFIVLGLTIATNFVIAPYHKKVDVQSTFAQITPLLEPTDVVYAATPLVYYESLYYTPNTTPVYLYNPHSITPPLYVGSGGMPPSTWRKTYPEFPLRAFLVLENGDHHVVSLVKNR